MRPIAKVAWVVGGYVAAGLVAALAVFINEALFPTDGPGSDGMSAFGDLLLFAAVFGCLALPPTFAAIGFVRTRKSRGGRPADPGSPVSR